MSVIPKSWRSEPVCDRTPATRGQTRSSRRGHGRSPLQGCVAAWFAFVAVLCSFVTTAQAQTEDGLSPLGQLLGPAVDAAIADEDRQFLEDRCPDQDLEALAACLQEDADATQVIGAVTNHVLESLNELFGADAVEQHADLLLSQTDEGLQTLANACEGAEDVAACITEVVENPELAAQAAAEPGAEEGPEAEGGEPAAEGGEIDYPEEALALLPKEVLDALPKVITTFLRPKDYQALLEACPQEDLEATIECLDTEEVTNLLDTLHTRAVVASILTYMDEELPNRMTPEQLDGLADNCEEEGGTWAECAFNNGLESEECMEAEETLSSCLVTNDEVTEVYLGIQKDKKEVFGPDLYVELRGLMSLLSLEDIKTMREACPQQEMDALQECLAENEIVNAFLEAFVMISTEMLEEIQKELTEAGNPMTEEQAEENAGLLIGMFLTMPLHSIQTLSTTCLEENPELEEMQDIAGLQVLIECMSEASHTDPVSNPAYISKERLRAWLGLARTKVIDVLQKKEEAAQDRSFRIILIILAIFGGIGSIIVLLMPLRLTKQYPDRSAELWKASAIAAVTFAVTVALLGGTLLVMRTVQGKVATQSTSPKMVVANGVFDVLEKDEYIEDLSAMSRERLDFIKTPLRTVLEASGVDEDARHLAFSAFVAEHWVDQLQEPELRPLAKNAAMLQEHIKNFKTVFGFYRNVDWIMGYVPLFMSLLAVVLYMIPLRETLVNIATAPAKAAQGNSTDMVAGAKATIFAELKLVGPFLAVMVAFLLLVGVFLSLAVEPLIEVLMSFSFMTVMYILVTEASGFVLYASLGGAILLLVGCIAIYILSMVFFIGTMRKILRAKFHWGQPFSRYKSFWSLGSLATVAVLLFPVGFAVLVRWIALEHVLPGVDMDNGNITAMDMLLVPLGGVILMPVLLWGSRCLKALGWVRKYPVKADTTEPS